MPRASDSKDSTMKTTTQLRSRYPSYRWGDKQFVNHVCEVSEQELARAKSDPFFGSDFWEDLVPAAVAQAETDGAGGGGGDKDSEDAEKKSKGGKGK